MDYLAYALLILALYKWWRYKRRSRYYEAKFKDKRTFSDIQASIIKQNIVDIAAKTELIEALQHRLELKDVNQDQWQELFVD